MKKLNIFYMIANLVIAHSFLGSDNSSVSLAIAERLKFSTKEEAAVALMHEMQEKKSVGVMVLENPTIFVFDFSNKESLYYQVIYSEKLKKYGYFLTTELLAASSKK